MATVISFSSLTRLRQFPPPSSPPQCPLRIRIRTPTRTRRIPLPTRYSPRMVFNGAPARSARVAGKFYRRLDSCLVIPPPLGRKPRAIIKFLGGAFVGAVPEVTYGHLMELLAKEGFLIVSVPYNVTFDHTGASREVYERFHNCMEVLLNNGLPDVNLLASDLISLPLYSVGHSNGALLQLLVGSYYSEKIPEANAVVSFNNKPASEAVPYFEQFGPVVSQVMPIMEANPMYSLARNASGKLAAKLAAGDADMVSISNFYFPAFVTKFAIPMGVPINKILDLQMLPPAAYVKITGDAWKALLDTAGTLIQEYDQEAMASLTKFADQLPSVMNQVTQGTSEFKPAPPENRELFKKSYSVPHTLLVKFSTDAIDETDLLEDILRPRVESIGGTLEKVTLSGNHLTPCIQDVKWQVGYHYTPADALAQGLKALSLNDTRVLARIIADWFKGLNRQ